MNRDEAELQIKIADLLRLYEASRGFIFFSVPNELLGQALSGGGLGRVARFRRMGLRPGASDLVICRLGRAYFLEVKSEVGVLSPFQQGFRDDATSAGCEYACVRSLDQAMIALKIWGIVE